MIILYFLINFLVFASGKDFNSEILDSGAQRNTAFWKNWFETQDKIKVADCMKEGYFANKEICSKFYRCVWLNSTAQFQRFDFTCATGTFFDTKLQKCDYAQNATTIKGCEYETYTPQSTTDELTFGFGKKFHLYK